MLLLLSMAEGMKATVSSEAPCSCVLLDIGTCMAGVSEASSAVHQASTLLEVALLLKSMSFHSLHLPVELLTFMIFQEPGI
jgi:hypothetical protein